MVVENGRGLFSETSIVTNQIQYVKGVKCYRYVGGGGGLEGSCTDCDVTRLGYMQSSCTKHFNIIALDNEVWTARHGGVAA